MKTVIETLNFYKKECFNKKYQSIVNHLLKNGYKSLNNTTFTITQDLVETRKNYFDDFTKPYPYSIKVSTQIIKKEQIEYRLAA